MKRRETDTVEIDTIHLAAFLLIKKIPIIKIHRSGRLGLFIFNAEKARPEIELYMAGKATVEPRAFASAIREIKRMVDDVILDHVKK